MSVSKPRQEAGNTYNRLSSIYNWLAAGEAKQRRKAVAMLEPKPGERILEIGCGTGLSISEMESKGANVSGIDLSWGMLRQSAKVMKRTCLCQADAVALPFPACTFDAVLMTFTLELFDDFDMACVLVESKRVLVDQGRLGVLSLDYRTEPNRMVRLYSWFQKLFPGWVDCRPIPIVDWLIRAQFLPVRTWDGATWGLPVTAVIAIPQRPDRSGGRQNG